MSAGEAIRQLMAPAAPKQRRSIFRGYHDQR